VRALTLLTGGILVAEVVRETQPHALPEAQTRYEVRWQVAAGPGGLWVTGEF
jgi:hypothetical protein